MPEISRFFGLVIAMYYRDHDPPHFHVSYGGEEAVFTISPVALLSGKFSARAVGLVTEWALLHQSELLDNWRLAKSKQALNPIAPLT